MKIAIFIVFCTLVWALFSKHSIAREIVEKITAISAGLTGLCLFFIAVSFMGGAVDTELLYATAALMVTLVVFGTSLYNRTP